MAYEGPARALVQALKFRGALPVAGLMAAQIAATLPGELRGGVVVPVPPQPARRRARGFDPAGALARALAARLELPLAPVLARRDRAGRQTRAGRSARREAGRIAVAAVARRPRRCCSSTTCTRPARRSTPAPARWRPRARARSPPSDLRDARCSAGPMAARFTFGLAWPSIGAAR